MTCPILQFMLYFDLLQDSSTPVTCIQNNEPAFFILCFVVEFIIFCFFHGGALSYDEKPPTKQHVESLDTFYSQRIEIHAR